MPSTSQLAILCALLWIAAAPLAHADQLADIKHKGDLVCGVLATDEPMSFVDPQTRTIIGYEVDLCKAVARKIGVTATVKQVAVARANSGASARSRGHPCRDPHAHP